MSNWIKTDWNFDLPMAVIVVAARQIKIITDNEAPPCDWEKAESVAAFFTALVKSRRPDLCGLTLVGMHYTPGECSWKMTVIHPSFPMAKFGAFPVEQRLDPCASCGKVMAWGERVWVRNLGARCVEVCSMNCTLPQDDAVPVYGVPVVRKMYDALRVGLPVGTEFEKAWEQMIANLPTESEGTLSQRLKALPPEDKAAMEKMAEESKPKEPKRGYEFL